MSWGITVNGLWINKVTPDQLKSRLEDNNNLIDSFRHELVALGAYTGATYYHMDGYCEALPNYVANRIPEILTEMEQLYCENQLIRHALDNKNDSTFNE